MKYFLGTIEYLVCRKMCSKYFENRLTELKKNLTIKFLNMDFLYKNLMKGLKIYDHTNGT